VSKRARIILGCTSGLVAVVIAVLLYGATTLEPRLHAWLKSTLSRSLESEVELGAVQLTWLPLRLHARNLTVRHHGRTDVPPLLVVSSFKVDLQLTDLWSSTVDRVWVDGLEVSIPPKDPSTGTRPLPSPGARSEGDRDDQSSGLIVRHLTATNARFAVIPREAGKNAKVWDIYELELKNLRSDQPAAFTAALINPIPYGKIEASGTFGPWQSGEPGRSEIAGDYKFAADLGTIQGLSGQLDATGSMSGTIEKIATKGHTKTPDFRLTELDGVSVPLTTDYDAVVDGTKGDVDLNSVDIALGRSRFLARGLVEGTKGIKGKRVVVNVTSKSADLGELLQMVSKAGRPAADGRLLLDAALDLPQGSQPVLDRVSIEGSVRAESVTFSNDAVQDKIDELSRRAQGRPADNTIDEVASRMAATFALRKGVFSYRGLSFKVKGADIRLAGTHSLRSKAIDLSGVALLNAAVSQTQTGYKSWLLKPFDPLFRKNGAGTRLAIKVAGTQDQPKVGLELGKTLRGQ
jgi:hypothetical protein